MIIEICTDRLEGAQAAHRFGAKRIELCAALSVGGLTPSVGLVKACSVIGIEVHTIIRHKEGGFVYDKQDVQMMQDDISAMHAAGARGVVFGILTSKFEIADENEYLLNYAKSLGLEVTFHRAFDFVTQYKTAIARLVDMGFDRLLTSGLQPKAIDGLDVLSYLQEAYGHEIQIMAGSGVNTDNALEIAKTGIQNLHFTARMASGDTSAHSMGELMMVDEEKIKNIIKLFH